MPAIFLNKLTMPVQMNWLTSFLHFWGRVKAPEANTEHLLGKEVDDIDKTF